MGLDRFRALGPKPQVIFLVDSWAWVCAFRPLCGRNAKWSEM